MTPLLERLSMIPRLTASDGLADCLAQVYVGWELLEADDGGDAILICKPCPTEWAYTRSKHLLILCGEAAVIWQSHRVTLVQERDMDKLATHRLGLFVTLAEIRNSIMPHIIGR